MTNAPQSTYPLTSPNGCWFDQILHDGVPLYNIGGYVKIPGPINPVLFEQAVNLLVQKARTLRTILIKEYFAALCQWPLFLKNNSFKNNSFLDANK